MPANIFTYGSLMFPEVWECVAAGRYRNAPAIVADHARFEVAGETYPGMVHAAGERVAGVVYFDVTAQDMAALDAFEGSDYRREMLHACLASGETVVVEAYIYRVPSRLGNKSWHPDAFEMERFVNTYCRGKLAE
jgi:gamma-glutamylcyclotransferase (GGCT)/AIG2-like uncharacterized protein YtfP